MRKIHLTILITIFIVSLGKSQTLNIPDNIGTSTNAGKVGIGTNTPNYVLTIKGIIANNVFGAYSTSNKLLFNINSESGSSVLYSYDYMETLKIKLNTGGNSYFNGGNVGIGTSSPDYTLDVYSQYARIKTPTNNKSGLIFDGQNKVNPQNWVMGFMANSTNFFIGNAAGNPNGGEKFVLTLDGNVGIGTIAPKGKLQIQNYTIIDEPVATVSNFASNLYYDGGYKYINSDYGSILQQVDGKLRYYTAPSGITGESATVSEKFTILQDGNVGIGTTNPQSLLAVNGTITSKEVKVTLDGWSDFVFDKDYVLKDLEDVESFIEENNHLPDVPSEKEVIENGIELGKMDAKLLQKIEELTLYMIDINKEVKALRYENTELKEKVKKLETIE